MLINFFYIDYKKKIMTKASCNTTVLDKKRTMGKYRARLRALPASTFREWFEGKWVSSFAIRSSLTIDQPIPSNFKKQYPVQAYLIALEKGIKPLGITTEHKRHGEFICSTRKSISQDQIAYIGRYSHFSGHLLRQEDNPFALKKSDKVYCESREDVIHSHYLRSSGRFSSLSAN